nr:putative ORF1 [Marmot picobirnavirus]
MTQNQIRFAELQELKRHNLKTEGQTDVSLKETGRHNVALESETNRHNIQTEGIQTTTNVINAQHYAATDAELVRHNQSTESETQRHNVVLEQETNRHNITTESTDRFKAKTDADIRKASLSETTRHNVGEENTKVFDSVSNSAQRQSQVELNLASSKEKIEEAKLDQARSKLAKAQTIKTLVDAGGNLANIVRSTIGLIANK